MTSRYRRGVTGVEYALWGLFGGFAVEGLEFSRVIRRWGTWPWRLPGEPGLGPLAASVVIRLGIGAGLAAGAGSAHQVAGPFGAVAVGVAAPLVVEQLARTVPTALSRDAVGSGPARPELEPPSGPSVGDRDAR